MLDVKDGQKMNVKLIDGAGRTVKQQNLTVKNQLAEFNIEDVQSGMYVIVAVTDDGDQFKNKLVIK